MTAPFAFSCLKGQFLLPTALMALCLAVATPAQQSVGANRQSDGTLSQELVQQSRATPFRPPLPPGSTELAYDSGVYGGTSRNLQHANLFPGWPYWALAVRFSPTAVAQGQLLEARYLAPTQWGASADFDLVVRDTAGVVLGTLTGLTAGIDSSNWQVVDLSTLQITVGANDFTLEMRPSNPCGSGSGFTLAYNSGSSGRSSASDDCLDAYSSFAVESRELFLRAVVADLPQGPTVTVQNLIAGNRALFQMQNLSPFGQGLILVSAHGPGPTNTAFGTLAVTAPWHSLSVTADSQGAGQLDLRVPTGAQGLSLWMQAVDSTAQVIGQALVEVVG